MATTSGGNTAATKRGSSASSGSSKKKQRSSKGSRKHSDIGTQEAWDNALKKAREEEIAAKEASESEPEPSDDEPEDWTQARDPNNDGMVASIKDVVQNKLWRACKFVCGAVNRNKVSGKVFELLQLQGTYEPTNWVETYGKEVNKAVNDVRGYAVGEIKKKLHDYWQEHGKKVPTIQEFANCLYRTIDPENAEQLDIFKFWWDQILDGACANKFDWCPDHRHFLTISAAGPNPGQGRTNSLLDMYMNPSTEAFALLVLENYRELWVKQFEWKDKNPRKKLPPLKKKENRLAGDPEFPATKWTDPHGGQQVYCGWSPAGLKQYDDYKKANKVSRITTGSQTLEAACLAALREDWGTTGTAPQKKKKARKSDEIAEFDTTDW